MRIILTRLPVPVYEWIAQAHPDLTDPVREELTVTLLSRPGVTHTYRLVPDHRRRQHGGYAKPTLTPRERDELPPRNEAERRAGAALLRAAAKAKRPLHFHELRSLIARLL